MRRTPAAAAKRTLGVPALPPPRATQITNRVRERLRWLHRTMAPPPVQILEALSAHYEYEAIGAFCRLGFADHLARQAAPAGDVARHNNTDEVFTARFLDYCASIGLVSKRRNTYRPNRTTKFLATGHIGGWRAWVDFAHSPAYRSSWAGLDDAIRAGESGTRQSRGEGFFDALANDNLSADAFNRAMEAGARMQGYLLAAHGLIDPGARVCDIGGGTGAALLAIADTIANITPVLLELQEVVDRVTDSRIEAVAGDMFASVPEGCDDYVMTAVLHDWSDEDCCRILDSVAAAMSPTSRLLVVEAIMGEPGDSFVRGADLLMLVVADGGRERSIAEFESLFDRSPLTLTKTERLANGFACFVLATEASR